MITVSHNPANDEVLIFCPVWKGDDGRVPKDSVLRLQRVSWGLRDVADNGRNSNVVCVAIDLNGTLPKDLESWVVDRFRRSGRGGGAIAAWVEVVEELACWRDVVLCGVGRQWHRLKINDGSSNAFSWRRWGM